MTTKKNEKFAETNFFEVSLTDEIIRGIEHTPDKFDVADTKNQRLTRYLVVQQHAGTLKSVQTQE